MRYAVTAVGPDKPGIVAGLSAVLKDFDGNIADCSMSLLGDVFALVLIVEADVPISEIENAMAGAEANVGVKTEVFPVAKDDGASSPGTRWTVSVYGGDHPGIVHAVASALAERGCNICDMRTHQKGELYTMTVEVIVPPGSAADDLTEAMQEVSRLQNVTCTAHMIEVPVL